MNESSAEPVSVRQPGLPSEPRGESAVGGRKVGVFGKGGAGKSTVTVLLARALADMGRDVTVLDADSTNVGLAGALGAEDSPELLMEHMGGLVFSGGSLTCPVDDPTPLAQPDLHLGDLPGEYVARIDENLTLLVAGKMGHLGPGAGCDGPIAKIARDVRVWKNGNQPVLLVDFKAGFEDSARGVITGLDLALVVVDPTTAAVGMAVHLQQMVERMRRGDAPATGHLETPELVRVAEDVFRNARIRRVGAILNRVPDEETESYLRQRLEEGGGPPVLGVIPEERPLQTRWLRGEALGPGRGEGSVHPLARSLVRALEEEFAPGPA